MSESLIGLLLRLSEAGAPALLWGRSAKPHRGALFERLLERGVLIEEAPAREWDLCTDCACDLDVRPIERIDGRLTALCPLDHRNDAKLDEDDLRLFTIGAQALVREIARASGFASEPCELVPGVWHLGRTPTKRNLFVALAQASLRTPALIAGLTAYEPGLAMTLVGPLLGSGERLRLVEAGVHVVAMSDAFASAGEGLALDLRALAPPASLEARLTLIRPQSKLVFDGCEIELPPISFKLLWLMAEEAVRGNAIVGRRQIERHLWPTVVSKTAVADAVRNLRHALKALANDKNGLQVRTAMGQGYALTLTAAQIRLMD